MPYTCPVCGYPNLPGPPRDYEICPSCGTEFEYHDARRSHIELRQLWAGRDAPWHSIVVAPPVGWNPWMQMIRAGYGGDVPRFVIDLRLQADAIVEMREWKSGAQLHGVPSLAFT